MFDLKTSENEKLSNELQDTIKQLEEKSIVLIETQKEKAMQEHLVAKHSETEEKIRSQAFQLRKVADEQVDDINMLQDSRERKR